MQDTGNTDSTEIQAGHHFQTCICLCCTSRDHSQRRAAMRKTQCQKWLFYGVTLSDFPWQILEYNTAARQEVGKVTPIFWWQCDGINAVRSSPQPWVDFSTLFVLSFAYFCRWKQFFAAQMSEYWHKLPTGYGDSSLEISKSCLDVGLGALLWASLLGQGLEQVDPEVPPCNLKLHVNPWKEPQDEKATLFFHVIYFPSTASCMHEPDFTNSLTSENKPTQKYPCAWWDIWILLSCWEAEKYLLASLCSSFFP